MTSARKCVTFSDKPDTVFETYGKEDSDFRRLNPEDELAIVLRCFQDFKTKCINDLYGPILNPVLTPRHRAARNRYIKFNEKDNNLQEKTMGLKN